MITLKTHIPILPVRKLKSYSRQLIPNNMSLRLRFKPSLISQIYCCSNLPCYFRSPKTSYIVILNDINLSAQGHAGTNQQGKVECSRSRNIRAVTTLIMNSTWFWEQNSQDLSQMSQGSDLGSSPMGKKNVKQQNCSRSPNMQTGARRVWLLGKIHKCSGPTRCTSFTAADYFQKPYRLTVNLCLLLFNGFVWTSELNLTIAMERASLVAQW